MSKRPDLTVRIPAEWTPEQALAVLELLNELRDTLAVLHGEAIWDYVREQQQHSDDIVMPDGIPDDRDPPF